MELIKQTVYLPVEDFEISVSYWERDKHITDVKEENGYFFTPEQLNQLLSDAIKQTLETAAEKAKVVEDELGSDEFREIPISTFESIEFTADKGYEECSYYRYKCSKQSITNTFEQTFNKFKV